MSSIIDIPPAPLPLHKWRELRRLTAEARRYGLEAASADPVIGAEFIAVLEDFEVASRVFDEFIAIFECRAKELEQECIANSCLTCTCRCEALADEAS
ncbi:hypothetical protein SAMN02745121_08972 [Nannocystis exedens]|uniref:Uncharacterized protein n=1 Tax=Nannocystis exedens TaxID=54 RepID=A0A1I2IVA3_9BACT|nr:hypothetical protein [Nannocystis exedens]PCC66987.1 hypothetical protein NAEX_09586 [Nannocystis exedens]PCC75756.1 hypothetical protein NAEX_08869 [Nannocystis exedens]SFF45660.1 hypothetical protein SAMN02745121_08972 [Nannocystis exedens]